MIMTTRRLSMMLIVMLCLGSKPVTPYTIFTGNFFTLYHIMDL
jgi:hypothetical protein